MSFLCCLSPAAGVILCLYVFVCFVLSILDFSLKVLLCPHSPHFCDVKRKVLDTEVPRIPKSVSCPTPLLCAAFQEEGPSQTPRSFTQVPCILEVFAFVTPRYSELKWITSGQSLELNLLSFEGCVCPSLWLCSTCFVSKACGTHF